MKKTQDKKEIIPQTNKAMHKEKIDFVLKILKGVVSVVVSIVSIFLTCAQYRISKTAEQREQRERGFSYSMDVIYEKIDNGQSRYNYHLQDGREIPAPLMQITVLTGDYKTMTGILYDGTTYQDISSFSSDPEKRKDLDSHMSVSVIDKILETPLVQDDILYDYFFLYVEPVTGEPFLDLICNEVNLITEELERQVYYHRTDLLELDTLEDSPKKTMLSVYAKLYENIQNLPHLFIQR